MLIKNENALQIVDNLSPEQIYEYIKNVQNYGSYKESLAELMKENPQKNLVVALNNDDFDAVANILLEKNPEAIVAGMKAVTKALEIKQLVCVVRDEKYVDELQDIAKKYGLNLDVEVADIVDIRKYKDSMMLHIETMAAYSDVLMGQTPGVLLAVDDSEPVEVPFGTKLSELLGEEAKAYKVNHEYYGSEFYESSVQEGAAYGSGRICKISDKQCMVCNCLEEIHHFREQTCGKCTFCREGSYQLEAILRDITTGKASSEDTKLIQELGEAMQSLNNCSLGCAAAKPVISILNNFGEEVEEHLQKHYCRSEQCKAFIMYYVDSAKCKGCGTCQKSCQVNCIDMKKGYTAVIDEFDCEKCGACMEACPNGAIKKANGSKQKINQKAVRLKGVALEKTDAKERKKVSRKGRHKTKIMPFKPAENVMTTKENLNHVKAESERGQNMKRLETDVVVVAGGPAGLAAAVTLGEHGIKSILFEKSNTTGGAANMGMGPLGINTKIQKQNFNNVSVDEALDMHMKYTHFQVDADLVQTYFHKSADTIEWLESLGVEFAGAYRYFKESYATWHIVKPDNGVIGPRAAGKMARILTEKAKEYGTEIYLETAATDLIYENDKVCGVIAKDNDGNLIEARAKAVVVATGGFGNNKEMIKEEFGLTLGEDYFPFQIPGLNGDGLKMMWNVGAKKFGTNIEAIYQLPDNATWSILDAVLRQPNLLINQFGDRFMNEGDMGNTTHTGNAIHMQPGNYAYCIMDEGILKEYKRNGPDLIDLVHSPTAVDEFDEVAAKAVEQGYGAYFEAESIEELAEKLGIDEDKLQDTIDEYNEMCEVGVDSKFHKSQKFLHPITGKGKYLVGKFYLGAYGTLGGVRINKYCEVLDEDLLPIEGLYSAGTDANTIYGDSYNFNLPGNSMGFAVNSGRMAAEAIADYLDTM